MDIEFVSSTSASVIPYRCLGDDGCGALVHPEDLERHRDHHEQDVG